VIDKSEVGCELVCRCELTEGGLLPLALGGWLLATGYWLLATGGWLLAFSFVQWWNFKS